MKRIDLVKLMDGKTPVNVTIDKAAGAVYFKMSGEKVAKTAQLSDSVIVDYAKDGGLVGIEIIHVNRIDRVLKTVFRDIYSSLPRKSLVAA